MIGHTFAKQYDAVINMYFFEWFKLPKEDNIDQGPSWFYDRL